jgi:hypothetical protein
MREECDQKKERERRIEAGRETGGERITPPTENNDNDLKQPSSKKKINSAYSFFLFQWISINYHLF